MKSTLKRIFTKSTIANESFNDTNNIKQEQVFSSMYKFKQNKESKSSKFQKVFNSNEHNTLDKKGRL